jgi:hypothetical protein
MLEVVLKYNGIEGSQEIVLENGKVSFGRGSEADCRLPDNGLSRLHATVHREGENVWILDENSTNGSFVNGEKVGYNGTPLKNGDEIKIGNETILNVRIFDKQTPKTQTVSAGGSSAANSFPMLIILGVAAFALLIISASAAFIIIRNSGNNNEIVQDTPYPTYDESETPEDDGDNKNTEKSPKPTASQTSTPSGNSTPEIIGNTIIETKNDGTKVTLPTGKYQDMSDSDKNLYIAVKAEKIAGIIGNQKAEPIPSEAVQEIKKYLNGYVGRLGKAKRDSCEQGSWVSSDYTSVLTRATRTSPMVVRAFNTEELKPQIGIYVAMIEGEHCPCLTSRTGAKGMFQFLASSWGDYDSDKNPNDRCNPEKSAKAGAKYLKSLIARYGAAPDSVPLAIASFNSGQGNLSKNLDTVFNATGGQNRNFWTLAANKNILQGDAGKQFNAENIKYVPKFFAAAIIGENPQDFGVNLQPLSTYR